MENGLLEDRMDRLERNVEKMQKSLESLSDIVEDVNQNIKTMNSGLYGDEKNRHKGIIQKLDVLEQDVLFLQAEIEKLQKKDAEKDTVSVVKKNVWYTIWEYVKITSVALIVIYLLIKGILTVPELLKLFL